VSSRPATFFAHSPSLPEATKRFSTSITVLLVV